MLVDLHESVCSEGSVSEVGSVVELALAPAQGHSGDCGPNVGESLQLEARGEVPGSLLVEERTGPQPSWAMFALVG